MCVPVWFSCVTFLKIGVLLSIVARDNREDKTQRDKEYCSRCDRRLLYTLCYIFFFRTINYSDDILIEDSSGHCTQIDRVLHGSSEHNRIIDFRHFFFVCVSLFRVQDIWYWFDSFDFWWNVLSVTTQIFFLAFQFVVSRCACVFFSLSRSFVNREVNSRVWMLISSKKFADGRIFRSTKN